jgi:hypothetical protein
VREDDFPTSKIFIALKALPQFVELYESERLARRKAFVAYLTELSGGKLPARMVVVDVGWKGTIQDNLFALLCRDEHASVNAITGYYVGLVAEGGACPRNEKHGLLFSALNPRSRGFNVFNENRALFEVLLAADHGSIIGYELDSLGHGRAIRGEFEEGAMLEAEVFPVQRRIMAHFRNLVCAMPAGVQGAPQPLDEVVRAHARMVFSPTAKERAWFSSVFHVENYGVFELSYFSLSESPGLLDRLQFLAGLLYRRGFGALGFWPWSTIYDRGGALPAWCYAAVRRLQR